MFLQLALLPATAAAALAGSPRPSGSHRRSQRSPAASPSPDAAENSVLEVALPAPLCITYATEASCVESWLSTHGREPVFGFDTETRPSYRKGEVFAPATLQLSTAADCLVVHLSHLDAPLPTALVELLAGDALKVGLGIDDDAVELWLHHGLEVNGRVELCSMEGAAKGSSLAALAEATLGVPLGKSKRLTMTPWDKRPLCQSELAYAAVDAWAGHACHAALGGGAGQSQPVAERSCAELFARRRVRRVLREQLAALDAEISDAGLPHAGPWPTAGSRQGKRQVKAVRQHIARIRSDVFRLLAADEAVASGAGDQEASAKAARRAEAKAQAAAARVATARAQAQAREEVRGAARQKEEAKAAARAEAAQEARRRQKQRRAGREKPGQAP